MKRQLLVHGAWALAACLAFVVGSRQQETASGRAEAIRESKGGSRQGSTGLSGRRGGGREAAADRRDGVAELFDGSVAGTSDRALEELARLALRDPNPVSRRLAFSRLLESLTPENAMLLRGHLVEFKAGGEEWHDFHYSWGALAGREAFEFALNSEERDMEAVMTGWSSAHPGEAMDLLDNLPEQLQDSRRELESSVVSGLADHDPDLATNYVLRLAGEGNERAGHLANIVAREVLRSGGPEDAALWAGALPSGSVKGSAMDQVAGAYVRQDPEAAAQWAQRFAGEEYATRAIEEVGDEWAERQPENAVAWLQTLPAGNGQMQGLHSAFDEWAEHDTYGAAQHLMTMSPGQQRDAAISGFVRGYGREDPVTAIAWAEDISNPETREVWLTRAGQSLFRRDPDAARTWVADSGLPAETQQQILNPPRRRR